MLAAVSLGDCQAHGLSWADPEFADQACHVMAQDEWTGEGQRTPRQAQFPSTTEENGAADDAAATGDADDNEVQVSMICSCGSH